MAQDSSRLLREFKGTAKILGNYADKYSNIVVAKELRVDKRKRNTEVNQLCENIINELDTLIKEQDEVFAIKRILQNVRLINLVFNLRLRNFSNFKTKLNNIEYNNMNNFMFNICNKVGNRYYVMTEDENYMKYANSILRNSIQSHLNKCNYKINEVEISKAIELQNLLKKLKMMFYKYKSYLPPNEVRTAQREIRKVCMDFSTKIKELEALNKGINSDNECVVNLTEEDCCYFGENDYVIRVDKAIDLTPGLENDIEKNLRLVSNLSLI